MHKILFILIIFVTACQRVETQRITGNYYLIWADAEELTELTYYDPDNEANNRGFASIIQPTIYAVGYNKDYIIFKQHPFNMTSMTLSHEPDKNVINYYILPIRNGFDWNTHNGMLGPLNKDEFDKERKKLYIENIYFTIVNKRLE